jgi:cell fate (sporulation/competence/biofilm development) regulator YlbF (YheA/YmcA/DUF963 family)
MDNTQLTESEIAPPSVVRSAGRDFAAALADTPQFKAFEKAYDAFTHDTAAQQAIAAYQAKVESLRALLVLNAVSESERAELEQLHQDYLTCASVQTYTAAEADLIAICQQAASMISAAIGIDYAAACGSSCCG